MESFLSRYKNILVLLTVLAVLLVGLMAQSRSEVKARRALYFERMYSYTQRIYWATAGPVGKVWHHYLELHSLRVQDQHLQREIDELRLRLGELREDAREAKHLQALCDFEETFLYPTLAAQVIGIDNGPRSRLLSIDKGSSDGVQPDMAVITPDGIVGKVRLVLLHSAQVLTIDDQTSGVGVFSERTNVRGVLKGKGPGQLEIIDIPADQSIQSGEKVVTSGGDLVFVRGLSVGIAVKEISDPRGNSFRDAIVKPAVRIDTLPDVLIISPSQSRCSAEKRGSSSTIDAQIPTTIEKNQTLEELSKQLPRLYADLPPGRQSPYGETGPVIVRHSPSPLRRDRFTPP